MQFIQKRFHFFFFKNLPLCATVLILCSLSTATNGYKILVLGPTNGPSHFLYVSSFVRALLDRGHEVTYLTSNSLKKFNLANYTEVLIDPPFDFLSRCKLTLLINSNPIVTFPNESFHQFHRLK